jgi:dynein heavy chain, axonemal
VFGFHENATITKDQNETNLLLSSILLTGPAPSAAEAEAAAAAAGEEEHSQAADEEAGDGDEEGEGEHEKKGGGVSRDDIILEVAGSNLSKIPEPFDMELAALRYPIKWEESMNTVISQELERFNSLRAVIVKSLGNVQKAVKGVVVMSDELEKVGDALFFGKVPEVWFATSYPSLKPLAPYMTDLLARLDFMRNWLDTEPPTVFWLSGLFFTTAFLTGCKQNFSRKYTIPIDAVTFDFEFFSDPKCDTVQTKPEDGAYCNGLFFDGAR